MFLLVLLPVINVIQIIIIYHMQHSSRLHIGGFYKERISSEMLSSQRPTKQAGQF